MVLDLRERHSQLWKGLRGVVYGMALHAADIDRFLDAGIIPVSKVQRTKKKANQPPSTYANTPSPPPKANKYPTKSSRWTEPPASS